MRTEITYCDCCGTATSTTAGLAPYHGYDDLCQECYALAATAFKTGREDAIGQDQALRSCVYGTNILAHVDERKVKEMIGLHGLKIIQNFKKALESVCD